MFEAKLTAVLNDESGVTAPIPAGLSGRCLGALEYADEKTGDVEEQDARRVRRPRHLFLRVDTKDAIDESLQGPEEPLRDPRLAFVDARHVATERLRDRDEEHAVEDDLENAAFGHEKLSGLNIATSR